MSPINGGGGEDVNVMPENPLLPHCGRSNGIIHAPSFLPFVKQDDATRRRRLPLPMTIVYTREDGKYRCGVHHFLFLMC